MKQYIVDAFTDTVFKGNPAAVCILDAWIPEGIMMKIAMENRFSETAFAVQEGGAYHLRWFTPGGEIDLCGHATLAAAYVIFHLWVIEAPESVAKEFPADKAGLNVLFVPSEEPYHQRKVTLLNGPHTVLAPVSWLSGVNIVRDACS